MGSGAFSIVKSSTSLLFAAFKSMCGPLYVQLYRGKLQGPERNHPQTRCIQAVRRRRIIGIAGDMVTFEETKLCRVLSVTREDSVG